MTCQYESGSLQAACSDRTGYLGVCGAAITESGKLGDLRKVGSAINHSVLLLLLQKMAANPTPLGPRAGRKGSGGVITAQLQV